MSYRRTVYTQRQAITKPTGSGGGVGPGVGVGVGSGEGVGTAADSVGMGSGAGDSAAGAQPANRARTRNRDSSLRFSIKITFLLSFLGTFWAGSVHPPQGTLYHNIILCIIL